MLFVLLHFCACRLNYVVTISCFGVRHWSEVVPVAQRCFRAKFCRREHRHSICHSMMVYWSPFDYRSIRRVRPGEPPKRCVGIFCLFSKERRMTCTEHRYVKRSRVPVTQKHSLKQKNKSNTLPENHLSLLSASCY